MAGTTVTYDVAIVGAGVIGLTLAYHLERRNQRVLVLERSPIPLGASPRNFGMIWPIGQPTGLLYDLSMASRAHWLELVNHLDAWSNQLGSLHVAANELEVALLQEFAESVAHEDRGYRWWDRSKLAEVGAPLLRHERLLGGLWSPAEVNIDPREIMGKLPGYLAKRGVRLGFNEPVLAIDDGRLRTPFANYHARQVVLCVGDEVLGLFPGSFTAERLVRCQLQMLRAGAVPPVPDGLPMLAAGLTLCHYRAFQSCRSLATLEIRLREELPDYFAHGIHVLVTQNREGTLTLGDSHRYGEPLPFTQDDAIDRLILAYLDRFVPLEQLTIRERWLGTYLKTLDAPWFVDCPIHNTTIVTGLGGAGMTLSLGLTEQLACHLVGEPSNWSILKDYRYAETAPTRGA